MQFFIRMAAWTLALTALQPVFGQSNPLPDIARGDVTVRLLPVLTGLPVEQEFVTEVFTQQVGPTDLATIPGSGGDMVVTTYGGFAYRFTLEGARSAEPFLDLRTPSSPSYNPRFEVSGAQGLTSIAFHPDFGSAENPGFKKFYTLEAEFKDSGTPDFFETVFPGNHHQDVLYEYTLTSVTDASCDAVCVGTKRELMRVKQPGWHHNLGDLLFAPDGLLYVSSADAGTTAFVPPFRSDNSLILSNVFGKVLRIDPLGSDSANGKYGIPPDNPFADGDGGNVDEIYSYGLRNPYRLELNSATGQVYASETGELSIESVEAITRGGNSGWNEMEGSFVYDKFTKTVREDVDADANGIGDVAEANGYIGPLFEYGRQDGIAVTGVAPYEGKFVPSLRDKLVVADFTGALFYGDPTTGELLLAQIDAPDVARLKNIHSVNRDARGEVYLLGIVDLGQGNLDGVVVRLQSTPAADGDFDHDGRVDASDIDALSAAVESGIQEPLFDVSNDGVVDQGDRTVWVTEIKQVWFGDADLNGEFDSSDLVAILASGTYGTDTNSSWATGDFTGDARTNSSDFVTALADGGYQAGPRSATRPAVPEPSTVALLSSGFALALWCHRRREDRQCLRSDREYQWRSRIRRPLNSTHMGLPACNCKARTPSCSAILGSFSVNSKINRPFK